MRRFYPSQGDHSVGANRADDCTERERWEKDAAGGSGGVGKHHAYGTEEKYREENIPHGFGCQEGLNESVPRANGIREEKSDDGGEGKK